MWDREWIHRAVITCHHRIAIALHLTVEGQSDYEMRWDIFWYRNTVIETVAKQIVRTFMYNKNVLIYIRAFFIKQKFPNVILDMPEILWHSSKLAISSNKQDYNENFIYISNCLF